MKQAPTTCTRQSPCPPSPYMCKLSGTRGRGAMLHRVPSVGIEIFKYSQTIRSKTMLLKVKGPPTNTSQSQIVCLSSRPAPSVDVTCAAR